MRDKQWVSMGRAFQTEEGARAKAQRCEGTFFAYSRKKTGAAEAE